MKLYISFGQAHRHEVNGEVFDADCLAAIECANYEEGRARAFEIFGPVWAFAYVEDSMPEMSYFSRGAIDVPYE